MNRLSLFFFLIVAICVGINACVQPFDPALKSDARRLVIESQLTTKLGFQYVYLTYDASYNSDKSVFEEYVPDAKVTLKDNLGNEFAFFDDPAQNNAIRATFGYNYRSVNKIQLVVGRTYQLFVETSDKKKYESTPEKVTAVPKIEKVTSVFREIVPAAYLTTERGEFKISIDVKDTPAQKNYYKWDWNRIEKLDYCAINRDGRLQECCQDCYEKKPCINCLELGTDNLIDGNSFNRFITNIPYDDTRNYYLVINQYSISENAHKFWNTVKQQSKTSGGLFDPTPKSIRGNFRNISNANEEVLGYFTVSDIHEEIVIIDRNLASPKPFFTPVVFGGECVPCVESFFRSRIKPKGWQ